MVTAERQQIHCDSIADQANQLAINLVLVADDGRFWVERNGHGGYALPLILIPKWRRVAQEVTAITKSLLGLEVVCLWEIRDDTANYLVAQILTTCNERLFGITQPQISEIGLPDKAVQLLEAVHRDVFMVSEMDDAEPFKRINWVQALRRAIQPALEKLDIALSEQVQQFNASPTFALLRLETTDLPVWFKAVGEPNLAEYSLTLALNELIPGAGPQIIATLPAWHGWLSKDSGGQRLDKSRDPEEWMRATAQFADLQISSLCRADQLIGAGCIDCRTPVLLEYLEPFREAVIYAMVEDSELDVVRLDRSQASQIARAIENAVSHIQTLGVPEALVHRDLSGGNIQISANHCYFIDWAQACISHPFVCAEYMLLHFSRTFRDFPNFQLLKRQLRDSYANPWGRILPLERIQKAFQHTALLAEYVYVLPMVGLVTEDSLDTREKRVVMRSMARRMWRGLQDGSTSPRLN